MLCDEYRMSAHGCLLPIIGDICRSLPFCNEILCVFPDRIQSFFMNIINILLLKMKSAPKSGVFKSLEQLLVPFILCMKTDSAVHIPSVG